MSGGNYSHPSHPSMRRSVRLVAKTKKNFEIKVGVGRNNTRSTNSFSSSSSRLSLSKRYRVCLWTASCHIPTQQAHIHVRTKDGCKTANLARRLFSSIFVLSPNGLTRKTVYGHSLVRLGRSGNKVRRQFRTGGTPR